MSTPAVEVISVGRTFTHQRSTVRALTDVSLMIREGEIVGLLGSNGAGKTTLAKILATLLLPTSGTARVCGRDIVRDVRAVRQRVSAVFGGDRGLYQRLSGRDNLRFFAALRGGRADTQPARLDRVLSDVGLADVADRPVETYSKGMRQRLHIAIGTIARPRVMLLDEPTVGLDPVEAERFRESVAGLREHGVAILLMSHYLLDVERLADRVAVLSGGRLVADTTVAELLRSAGWSARMTVRGRGQPPGALLAPPPEIAVDALDTTGPIWTSQLRIRGWDSRSLGELSRVLDTEIVDVEVSPLRLEDVYEDWVRG